LPLKPNLGTETQRHRQEPPSTNQRHQLSRFAPALAATTTTASHSSGLIDFCLPLGGEADRLVLADLAGATRAANWRTEWLLARWNLNLARKQTKLGAKQPERERSKVSWFERERRN